MSCFLMNVDVIFARADFTAPENILKISQNYFKLQ